MKKKALTFLWASLLLTAFSCTVFPLSIKQYVAIPFENSKVYFSDFFDSEELKAEGLFEGLQKIVFGFSPLSGKSFLLDSAYFLSKLNQYFPNLSINKPYPEMILIYRTDERNNLHSVLLSFPKDISKDTAQEKYIEEPEDISAKIKRDILSSYSLSGEENTLAFSSMKLDFSIPFYPEDFLLEYEISLIKLGGGSFLLKVYKISGQKKEIIWNGKVNPVWFRKVAVAKRNISYGEQLNLDSVNFKELNFFELRDPVLLEKYRPELVSRSFIKEGSVLSQNQFKDPPYVKAGQIIMAFINIGGVTIKAQVQILQDSNIGEIVRAKNTESGFILSGKIIEGPFLLVTY